jgi:hypothetical protein
VCNELISLTELPESEQLAKLEALIKLLPEVHRNSAHAVFFLIYLVAQNSEVNRMHMQSICKMLAPNLLHPSTSVAIDISAISCSTTVIEVILLNYVHLFEKVRSISA